MKNYLFASKSILFLVICFSFLFFAGVQKTEAATGDATVNSICSPSGCSFYVSAARGYVGDAVTCQPGSDNILYNGLTYYSTSVDASCNVGPFTPTQSGNWAIQVYNITLWPCPPGPACTTSDEGGVDTGWVTFNPIIPTSTPTPAAPTPTPNPSCDNSCTANTCQGTYCTNSCDQLVLGTKVCSGPTATPTPLPPTPTPTPIPTSLSDPVGCPTKQIGSYNLSTLTSPVNWNIVLNPPAFITPPSASGYVYYWGYLLSSNPTSLSNCTSGSAVVAGYPSISANFNALGQPTSVARFAIPPTLTGPTYYLGVASLTSIGGVFQGGLVANWEGYITINMTTATTATSPNVSGVPFSLTTQSWWQTQSGFDVLDAVNNFWSDDFVPSTQFALTPVSGENPGMLFGRNLNTGGTTSQVSDGTSPNNWDWYIDAASNSNAYATFPAPTTSYDSINSRTASLPTTGTSLPLNPAPTGTQKYVFPSGNAVINGLNVPGNSNYIVLVPNGNLEISDDIIVPKTSTLLVSVHGNITVDSNVTEVDGIYSSDNTFIAATGASTSCPTTSDGSPLAIYGNVIVNAASKGGNFDVERTLCTGNTSSPAVVINERPDFLLHMPAILQTTKSLYTEVNP